MKKRKEKEDVTNTRLWNNNDSMNNKLNSMNTNKKKEKTKRKTTSTASWNQMNENNSDRMRKEFLSNEA